MKIIEIVEKYLKYVDLTACSNQYFLYEKKELSDFLTFSLLSKIDDHEEITKDLLLSYIEFLKNKLVPNGNKTINKKIATLRRAVNYCELEVPAFSKIKNLKEEEKHFLFLNEDELLVLISYVKRIRNNSLESLTEKLVFLIYIDTAVRVSELLDIKIKNINIKNKWIKLNHTKAHRERFVFFGDYTKKILSLLLEQVPKDQIYLFFNFKTNQKMTYRNIRTIIERCEAKTGLKFSSHVLRHSTATVLADSGMNLNDLKLILGHKNIKTTEIYLHSSAKRLKKSYDKVISKSILK